MQSPSSLHFNMRHHHSYSSPLRRPLTSRPPCRCLLRTLLLLLATCVLLLSSLSSPLTSFSCTPPFLLLVSAATTNQTDASCAFQSGNECNRCEFEFCAYCLDGDGSCQLATAPCASSYIYYGQTCPDDRGQVHGLSSRDSLILGLSLGLGMPFLICICTICVAMRVALREMANDARDREYEMKHSRALEALPNSAAIDSASTV